MKKLLIALLVINAGLCTDVALQSISINNSFINELYYPTFVFSNTGNETLLVYANLTNISLTITPLLSNPDSIAPNNVGVFSFEVEAPKCNDYLKTHYPVLNLSYNSSTGSDNYTIYFNFTVKSPISITLVEPLLDNALTIPVNSFNNLLLIITNYGLSEKVFNISGDYNNLLLNYLVKGKQYFNSEVFNQNFSINPSASEVIKVTVIPSAVGSSDVQLNFFGSSDCNNISDSINFTVNSFSGRQGVFGITTMPSLSPLSICLLVLIVSLFIFKKH